MCEKIINHNFNKAELYWNRIQQTYHHNGIQNYIVKILVWRTRTYSYSHNTWCKIFTYIEYFLFSVNIFRTYSYNNWCKICTHIEYFLSSHTLHHLKIDHNTPSAEKFLKMLLVISNLMLSSEWVITFNGLFSNSGQRGPCDPYESCNHDQSIGIIISPHRDNIILQATRRR